MKLRFSEITGGGEPTRHIGYIDDTDDTPLHQPSPWRGRTLVELRCVRRGQIQVHVYDVKGTVALTGVVEDTLKGLKSALREYVASLS